MDFTTFVRKPFIVEAVEITEDNIAELSKKIGELKYREDNTPFILVNRKKVPNVIQVFPGFWMTQMGNNIRCYSPEIFKEQFVENTPIINDWVTFLNLEKEPLLVEGD